MISKQRVAIIGAGNWGKNHVRVFYNLNVLKAVAEVDENLRNKTRDLYPGVEVYDSYIDIINNSDIDAIVIATPAHTHYEISKMALMADKDVLVEKPMTLSVKEAQELVYIAETRKKVLMVGHLLLYKPAIRKIMELVQGGHIGDLRYIEMRRLKLGKVRSQENVLWSFAPHDVAVLLSLVNAPIKKIKASGLKAIQKNIEDDVHVDFIFEKGVQAHIHVSWIWPQDERMTIIIGTNGVITFNENENKVLLHRKGVNSDLSTFDEGSQLIQFDEVDALEAEALHFLECIKNGFIPLTDGKKGENVIKVLVQAGNDLEDKKEYFVHDSAYIDNPVEIGEGTQIWHFTHVMPEAVIGNKCKIGQNVFIARGVKMGNNVKIQNNVSLYEGVILEDNVFCGPSMVFTNIKTPRSDFPRNSSEHYLKTLVKKGASIGANATIVCGVTIGKYALIGAGSVVTKDVPDFTVVYGNPAQIKGWTCRCGSVIVFNTKAELECNLCNTKLQL